MQGESGFGGQKYFFENFIASPQINLCVNYTSLEREFISEMNIDLNSEKIFLLPKKNFQALEYEGVYSIILKHLN